MRLPNIIGKTEDDLVRYVEERGFRSFYGRQMFQWVYLRLADDFASMTDLPVRLRESLSRDFVLRYYRPVRTLLSREGDAVKHVFRTEDAIDIENVVLSDREGRTSFCVSSQIGCPVGCIYCATGIRGFVRNLKAGEILNEVLSLEKLHTKPESILFMGMGEPLLNYSEVVETVLFLNKIGFGPRKITISTFGIPSRIRDLSASGLRPRLAVSIGSSLDEKRKRIIPNAEHHSLAQLGEALRYYQAKTRRRITLEYTLMGGVNDTPGEASALAHFARGLGAHVNIIRYNPIAPESIGSHLSSQRANGRRHWGASALPMGTVPTPQAVDEFKEIVQRAGVRVTERYRRGGDIGAACGQLVYSRRQAG